MTVLINIIALIEDNNISTLLIWLGFLPKINSKNINLLKFSRVIIL